MPPPSGLQTGIPTGHPNSTVLMSSPMRFRSSAESPLIQSRTGSLPASVRKKIAGIRLPCFSADRDAASAPFEDLGLQPIQQVYHIRYISRGGFMSLF